MTDGSSWVNLRDVGGIPLVGGGTTASGVLLRSGAPRADVMVHGARWPPRVVIDLRNETEPSPAPCEWATSTIVRRFDIHYNAAPDLMPRTVDWFRIYGGIAQGVSRDIAGILEALTTNDAPALVHCSAGKDRTGVLVACLLIAVGAEVDAVMEDYLCSAVAMRRYATERAQSTGSDAASALESPYLNVSEDALRAALATMTDGRLDDLAMSDHFLAQGASADHLAEWRARLRSC